MNKNKRIILRWQEKIWELEILKRDIKFNYEYLQLNKIITFVWPRRAGKTYFMFSILQELIKEKKLEIEQIIFIDFTSFLYDDFDIEKLLEDFFELYPDKKPFFVFDEIQELENFNKIVMYLFNSGYKIFLSWSNSKLLSSELSTIFRWRTVEIKIFSLKFKEFLYFKNIEKKEFYTEKDIWLLKNLIQEFLEFWSYPEIVLAKNKETKYELIKWYFSLLLYKDLFERHWIENEYVIKYLIKKLLLTTTKQFNINKTFNELKSQNIKIGKQTIYNYLEYLKEMFFIKEINDLFRKWAKKFFFYDVWYNNILLLENLGQRFENVVFLELFRKFEKVHYKKENNTEIDFIIEEKNLNIQVCYELNNENLDREIKPFLKNTWENILVYFEKEQNLLIPKNIKVLNYLEFVKFLENL